MAEEHISSVEGALSKFVGAQIALQHTGGTPETRQTHAKVLHDAARELVDALAAALPKTSS